MLIAILATTSATAVCGAKTVGDKLTPPAPGNVHFEGWLGDKIDACLANRVMSQDVNLLLRPFQDRPEVDDRGWRSDYWGRWCTAAVNGYAYDPIPANRRQLDRGISGLLATQSPDGYIGTNKAGTHLLGWDVWGRKRTLLGLMADYDVTGNKAALDAAVRVADQFLEEAPPGKFNLTASGMAIVKGLPPSSILEPIALLYERTGHKRYLDLANDIVACWDKPNDFVPTGLRLEQHALNSLAPVEYPSTKAYEMMCCFSGLCELYRATGNSKHLEAAIKFAESVCRTELMVHGSGSNQELWCDGARTQTETLEQPVETCVTVTWMELCSQLLRLTGDSRWADYLEVSLYNALAGAMTPKGDWWAYFSPLSGQRIPSQVQQQDCETSCCVASGPNGLLLTPSWAIMNSSSGVVINVYSASRAKVKVAGGVAVNITQKTDYPVGDEIILTISPERKASFPLKLRIPAWSKRTSLLVNGKAVTCTAGSYCEIAREWSPGDQVVLKLDLRGRAVPAPSGAPEFAVMRGPVLLALDNRLAKPQDDAVRLVKDQEGFVPLKPSPSKAKGIWMAYDVPFEVRPTHFFKHHQITLTMCDYSSAGNEWTTENLFRVWLPQPLYLRDIYPTATWQLLYPGAKKRPSIPGGKPGQDGEVYSALDRP